MLFAASRSVIGKENEQEWGGNRDIKAHHDDDPGEGDPLQAKYGDIPGNRGHLLAEALPLRGKYMRQ